MFQVFWGSQVVCPYSATQHGSLQGYCTMAFAVKSLGNGDVNLVTIMLTGQTSFVTTLAWSLPISGDKLYCEAVVERRNGPNYNSHTTTTTTWPF